MAKLVINGKEIIAEDNANLLEVIKENKIDEVPTLCNNKFLEPFTSCFLCVVDIEGARSLRPACATTVMDGMVLSTNNERVRESRKTNLELLLSNHHADCYPPCRLNCPANVDIQGYIALTARGLYKEGQKLMKETNPLSMVCGRVCAKPCESACRRQYVDEAVDIKNIKRFLADTDLESGDMYVPETGPDTGKKVAVIGSGPAGLSAAYYLRIKGHGVTIFEKLPQGGGMMRYGIPEYRLPKADLQKEIDSILSMGAEIKYNQALGEDITIDGLFDAGYDSVFLGIGAQLGSKTGTAGHDLEGVMQGVDFLRDVTLGKDIKLHGNVFVVGGGNAAIDAARSALRLGAGKVSIVYRRSEAEMPAHHEEIEDAKAEGIELKILNNPVEYIGENGKLTSIKLIKMQLGEPDASGRRRPEAIEGSEYEETAAFVIEAIGQKIDTSFLDGIELTNRGAIMADENLFLTSRKGVFAGGDAVTGPWIIIGAVAQGRKAAHVIDQYLKGEKLEPENRLGFHIRKEDFEELTPEDFKDKERIPRNQIGKESADTRTTSFIEVEKGFTHEDVLKEAARCMECGCQDIHECKLKKYSQQYEVEKEKYIGGEYRRNLYESVHRYIDVNTEKCVNCGQCIRICAEVQKQSVFAFDKRGFEATPVPYVYKALDETNCIACGSCVSTCPVGAITERLPLGKPGPFENRLTESYCNRCGDGCKIVVEARDGNFVKIASKIKNEEFFDNLCKKGRFGYEDYAGRANLDIQGGSQADVVEYLGKVNKESTLLAISPELTLEEIDRVSDYAADKQIDLYSFEIGNDIEKLKIIQAEGIELGKSGEREYGGFKDIYYFGSFDENANSVVFRKLIRNDKEQNIYLSADMTSSYFNYTGFDSDSALFDFMKDKINDDALIVFNLQKIDADALKELAGLIKTHNIKNYLVLNSYVNYGYVLDKISDPDGIARKLENKAYDTLISVNEDEEIIQGEFKDIVAFKDKDMKAAARFFVPINSIYEKTGHFMDEFGEKKQAIKAIKDKGITLRDFFV